MAGASLGPARGAEARPGVDIFYPGGVGNAPAGFGNAPAGFGNAPAGVGNAPAGFGNVPAHLGRAPGSFGNAPARFGRAPAASGNVPRWPGSFPRWPGSAPGGLGNRRVLLSASFPNGVWECASGAKLPFRTEGGVCGREAPYPRAASRRHPRLRNRVPPPNLAFPNRVWERGWQECFLFNGTVERG
jgi:hypothetical protein